VFDDQVSVESPHVENPLSAESNGLSYPDPVSLSYSVLVICGILLGTEPEDKEGELNQILSTELIDGARQPVEGEVESSEGDRED
jgi:hypothetical protein